MNTKRQKDRICIVLGTRPEIIKLSPVIREMERSGILFFTIHTGQHYSVEMDAIFIRDLMLPQPEYNLGVGSGSHATQTAKMLTGIEETLMKEKPAGVIVQGDTNSVLAGALAASKLQIPIFHIEAGLRSYDRKMPEEINRIIAGRITKIHFAPTHEAKTNLIKEGVPEDDVIVTGNTIVDALYQNREIALKKSTVLNDFSLKKNIYGLVTVHRPENTDSKIHMGNILVALKRVTTELDIKLIWPMHPRTKKQIEILGISESLYAMDNLIITEPINFFDMLTLEDNASVVITDSGGIQEESCILHTPCVTLRSNTERPESVEVGANILAGNDPNVIVNSVKNMSRSKRDWNNPFGDGKSALLIVSAIKNIIDPEIQAQNKTVHERVPQEVR